MVEALLARWKDVLLRMFDIRMGEFRRVWLMQLNVFLLIQCLWIIKPVVNAQFLSRVGIDKLPLVFLLVALSALALSATYSRLLSRMSLGTLMMRTYLISIVCLLTFAVLLHFRLFEDWMSYLFYIGVAMFGLITTSQFWLMGNSVFSSLEAKRLFGFIGAGAIAGGISGGYVTSLLAPLMDSGSLLFVASALLLISMRVNNRIWVNFVSSSIREVQPGQANAPHEFPIRLIRNSKHLSYLALIMGISVVVAKLVEFQFSAIASERIQDPDQLTAYFGFWFSTSNVVSLIIQLLITQRVVAFLGVGRSLYVLPGALFAGAAAVLYSPVLWAGTTLKLFDISLKQSINKAATELLILPVPTAIKNQAKTFIDVFVDTTATGIGGIMLIFLINGFDLSVRAVCIMILALICLWVYFAMRVRKEYILAFQERLGLTPNLSRKKDLQLPYTTVLAGMRRTLQSGSTNQIVFLLSKIEESKDPRLMQDVIPLLRHDAPAVRQAVLRCLYYHKDHTITAQIEQLLKDTDAEVRSRAFSTLLAHTRQNRANFIEGYLKDPDPAIRGAALIGLATEVRDNPEMQQAFNLEQQLIELSNQVELDMDLQDAEASKIVITRAVGYGRLSSFYPLLIRYMKDDNPEVAKQAILSAGHTQDPYFIKIVLPFLSHKSTRLTAHKALARFEAVQILPILMSISHERGMPEELLIQLPALAETMDTQEAVDFLFGLVQHQDPGIQQKALESLHTIKEKHQHLTISSKQVMSVLVNEAEAYRHILSQAYAVNHPPKHQGEDVKSIAARREVVLLLRHQLDIILKRIFWSLGLTYPPGTIIPLYKDVRHEDQSVRINAVELLDNILEANLKALLIPILESAIQEEMADEVVKQLDIKIHGELASLESLLRGNDDLIKLAVLDLIEALNKEGYTHLLHIAAQDDRQRVRTRAETILRNTIDLV